jgi:CHAT domain-containing protein/Tfp pilus assembly protein PilF
MIRLHSIPTQSKYRLWLLNFGLVITISLLVARIQAYPSLLNTEVAIPMQENLQSQKLELDKPIERDLTEGQSHSYQITLAPGQYVKLVVSPRSINVGLALFGPNGKQIAEFGSVTKTQDKETVEWVAEETGNFRLDVLAKRNGAAAGRYKIQVVELRVGTENDRALHEARKLNIEIVGLFRAGKFKEARPLAERQLAIHERVSGAEHIDTATSVNNLAIICSISGDQAKAELLFQRSLTIREKTLGPRHLDVAQSLNNLARIYNDRGDYTKAESFYERALPIFEEALGSEHPVVAQILNNLAIVYNIRNNYERAEQLGERALAVREKVLGPEHPEVAQSSSNLGTFYKDRGDYAKAEPLYERALDIFEKALGPEHPDLTQTLYNLADLYQDRGDYAKAEQLFQRALAVSEKGLGPEHPIVAQSLNNLAKLHQEIGNYAKAEPLHIRALTIYEKAVGREHPDVAQALNNLAKLYSDGKGDYAKAEPLYERALAIWETALGPGHTEVALALSNLAILHRKSGDYAKAELLYERALNIYEKVFGREHPSTAFVLNNLSLFYAAKGDIGQAITTLSRANAVDEHNFAHTLAIGSERQKIAFLDIYSKWTNFTLSLQSEFAPNDPRALNLAFTTLLRRKTRGLDAMADTIATFRRDATPQDRDRFDRLKVARSQLAALTLNDPGAVKLDTYRTRVTALEEVIDDLEAELSSRSYQFFKEHQRQSQPVTLSAVQAALPANSALIEFAYFTPLDPKTEKSEPSRYLVYVLAPQGQPNWVDLGEAALIEQAIDEWRKALRNPNRTDVKRFARAVDELLMQPVRALLSDMQGNASTLLISPDGSLNLIPFAALVDEENRYLIERYSITHLTSGRDLLRLQTSEPSKGAPLVVANPDFGSFSTIAMRGGRASGKSPAGKKAQPQIDPTQLYFYPLPSTEDEALAIKELLPKASLLQQEEATETALKQFIGPQILHIATHGFFLDYQGPSLAEVDKPGAASSGTTLLASSRATPYTIQFEASPALETAKEKVKGLKARGVDAYIVKSEVNGKGTFFRVRAGNFRTQTEAQKYGTDLKGKGAVSEFFVARYEPPQVDSTEQIADLRLSRLATKIKDPLLRSGLALAGANHGKSGEDDGVLTALEAAYLDLSGTKLVVLSACDTGVGELKKGEGVQGLRRALVLAGSESQVMSLWPVSDEATKDLMIPYYKALKQGEGRSEGLRQVQLRMLHGPKDRQHPFYWAAFIQSGEWANLDGQR